jgi:hypothetical protein
MYFNRSYEVLLAECPVLLGFAALVLLAATPRFRQLHGRLTGSSR